MPDSTALLAMVTPMIGRDEGCRLKAYKDTLGNWTIGWGRADPGVIEGMTCTQAQADMWRNGKLVQTCIALDHAIPWWRNMILARQAVLVDMAYEMGVHGLLGFHQMLHADETGNWAEAEADMKASHWATQAPNRAARLWTQMLTGEVQ